MAETSVEIERIELSQKIELIKSVIDEFKKTVADSTDFLGRLTENTRDANSEMSHTVSVLSVNSDKINESLDTLVKSIQGITTELSDASDFIKNQKKLVKEPVAKVSDDVGSVVSGSDKATQDAVQPETEMPSKGQATLTVDMPKVDAVFKAGIGDLTPPVEKQTQTVEKIYTSLDKYLTKTEKTADKNKIDDLMGKKKESINNVKQMNATKQAVVLDAVAIGKELAHGIKGTLEALLNPVAIVAAFIVKFAPYIFLAICFLYGVWTKLSDDIKEQVKLFGATIIPTIIGAFVTIKGVVPAIIKAVSMAIKIVTLATKIKEHKAIMAIYAKMAADQQVEHTEKLATNTKEAIQNNTIHGARMSNTIFSKLCTSIEHGAEMAKKLFEKALKLGDSILERAWTVIKGVFDMACNVTKVIMAAAAIAIIIGLVVLLVAGIFVVMTLLSSAISDAVANIIVQFTRIGKEIKEMVSSIIDPITQVLTGLMDAMRQLFYDVKYGDETALRSGNNVKQNDEKPKPGVIKGEVTIKDGITKEDFNTVVTAITAPLNVMVLELGTMIALETAQLITTNPFGALVALGTSAIGAGIMMNRTANTATTSDNSETNIQRQENTTNNNSTTENGFDPEFKKKFIGMCDDLNKLIKKLQPIDHLEFPTLS